MSGMMKAAFLPGNSDVEIREVSIPEPGHGEVLLQVKASTICGSDIRCIYHEHLGKGPEGYQGVIAGHEPAGLRGTLCPQVGQRAGRPYFSRQDLQATHIHPYLAVTPHAPQSGHEITVTGRRRSFPALETRDLSQ